MKEFRDHSLKSYNTFGIEASCRVLYKIQSAKDLIEILKSTEGPYFILGGGSNLLISKDQNLTVLKNEIEGKSVIHHNDDEVYIKVGGGEDWHQFVLWTIAQGYGGVENLSLIPGTVGASPIQNIGAYGVELDQVFFELEAINMATLEETIFTKEDCTFGYRDSIFKRKLKGKYFITSVTFKLTLRDHKINMSYGAIKDVLSENKITKPTIKDVSDAVIEIRTRKLPDPAVIGNSGSFFKNPIISSEEFDHLKSLHSEMPSYPHPDGVKVPAGWLIDQAGWKGKRKGDAGCYKNQALVIVNHGKATGDEILSFAYLIIEDVKNKYGITLVPEVNII